MKSRHAASGLTSSSGTTSPTRQIRASRTRSPTNLAIRRINSTSPSTASSASCRWAIRYAGSTRCTSIPSEDYNSLNGQPPQNTDYATAEKYPAVTYHDIRASYDVSELFNAYVGVNNVSNKQPPFGVTGVGAGSAIYDNRGRFGYIGVTARF
ncbi:TonB-dependent receptor [Sphingomonas aerolata]